VLVRSGVESTQTATSQSGRSPFGQLDVDPAGVLAPLEDPQLSDAVVCTHGEVIGQVLTRRVADGLAVDQPLTWPKGSTWPLQGANRRPAHARYLPPLALAEPNVRVSEPLGTWVDSQDPILAPDAGSRLRAV
jgi:hypothetical protein